ncbi:hypothetical protein F5B22DRAFT_642573 [Xylaria bambusicola]|uniref:uncharacterized protein n=1 Tax=Xylaria bambusicola TaxID=326684 RepID=UPI0020074A5A|nr:uncharacterized protein F5B22DRAFT_642573 [Xylaria bambusicola]KAI0525562.1 hypothetical protein F5B22DRAFT_642573 [Xylaria bambusicola]
MDDEDGDGGMDSPTGGKSISGAVPGLTPLRPGHVSELPQEIETESSVLMSTPQAGGSSSTLLGTPTSSRTFTRPTLKGYFNSILVENPSSRSQAQDRLRFAIAREGVSATISSHLEEARDIHYEPIEADDIDVQEPQDDESGENSHPTVGGLRIPRRSDRIRAKNGATREPSPSTALAAVSKSTNNRVQKRRKKTVIKTNLGTGTLRRSARLAKPLDVFHKYPELPEELKLMVWEAAIQPRLTYICNRSSILGHAHSFGIQNKFPTWFMACQASVWVAMRCYKKLFGQKDMSIHPSIGMTLRPQAINTQVDIVVFEPCHNGCRGYYCAQQYSREDRDTVERLAVQIDSPHLPPGSEPGWATISKSWPGVETLFMMKPAVKGLDQSDKAMIRIKEGDHELALRKGFEAWKKDAGKSSKLTTLEFVRIVEQEPDTKKLQDRYQSVEDRKTGSVEDIILG